jgi:hypothetical protein
VPGLSDPHWLRQRLEAGASAAELGDELGVTARDVRNALRRHDLPLPRDMRVSHVDWDKLEYDWRKGYPVRTIARLYRLTEHQVVYRMRDVPRTPQPVPRPSKYPLLNDPAQLRISLALGRTVADIAREAGCARRVAVAALRRHEITVPARDLPPIERVKALTDRVERAKAAELLEIDLRAQVKAATMLKQRAQRPPRRDAVGVSRRRS